MNTARIERARWEGIDVDVLVDADDAVRSVRLSGSLPIRLEGSSAHVFYRRASPIVDAIRIICTICRFVQASLPCNGSVLVFPFALGQLPYHYFVINNPQLVRTDEGYRLDCAMLCPRCRLERETRMGREFDRKDESETAVV